MYVCTAASSTMKAHACSHYSERKDTSKKPVQWTTELLKHARGAWKLETMTWYLASH